MPVYGSKSRSATFEEFAQARGCGFCNSEVLVLQLLARILNWRRRKVSTKAEKTIEIMAVYGNVGVFDEKVESFEDYRDRVDCFMSANYIDQAKHTDLFLAIIGPDAFKLVKNLCGPAKLSSNTYDQLKNLMNNHYNANQ